MHRKKIRRVDKKALQQVAVDSQERPHILGMKVLELAEGQTSLFFSLATELLLEIISYLPKVPERAWVSQDDPFLVNRYCERPDTLRALSQTCRALRIFFLPMYWEYLDVCTNRFGGAWHLHISSTLEARSIGLHMRPDLAAHVRVANVILTRCSANTVLPEFAQCLSELPNLHTLQIIHAHSQMTTVLGHYFQDLTFPSVRTITLQAHAHNILRRCPEVRTVVCTEGESSRLVGAIRNGCPKVEVVRGFNFNVAQMKALIRAVPNLRCIEIYQGIPPRLLKYQDVGATVQNAVMEMLGHFKKLSTIEIIRRTPCLSVNNRSAKVEDMIKVARNVLQNSNTGEKKALRVISRAIPGGRFDSLNKPATFVETVEEIAI